MAPGAPALAWAEAAVSLGRGRAGTLPSGPRPADPEIRLLVARASLAAGGDRRAVGGAGRAGCRRRALTTSTWRRSRGCGPRTRTPRARAGDDPVRAYVDGLRARLDGKLDVAAERLRYALSGHGDACRAAGEYRATLRALKQKPEPSAFAALRAENSGCVNLPRP